MRSDKINKIFQNLTSVISNPKTELKYQNPYTFLVSVVLSAQATDKSVNAATKELFKKVREPNDMIKLGEKKLKSYIKTIVLYNSKAKNIINLSRILTSNSSSSKSTLPALYTPHSSNSWVNSFQLEHTQATF